MTQPINQTQIACSIEDARARIQDNWERLCSDVARCAKASGRSPESIRIVGVSKYVDAPITSWLLDAGCHDLGENRPQALMQKHAWFAEHRSDLAEQIRWHQIGHLQRNKVRRLLPTGPLIHSINSERLLNHTHAEAQQQSLAIDVLMEINVSGEDAKTGLPEHELAAVLDRFSSHSSTNSPASGKAPDPGVHIIGLMAMAGWGTQPEQARAQFAHLRTLRDTIRSQTGWKLPELSMGMSGDYEAAIGEGATMIRIGSSLFKGVLDR